MKIKKAQEKQIALHKKKELDIQTFKNENLSIKNIGYLGAKSASEQVDGGEELRNAAMTEYMIVKPIASTTQKGTKGIYNKIQKDKEKRSQRSDKKESKKASGKGSDEGKSSKGKKRKIGILQKAKMLLLQKNLLKQNGTEGSNNQEMPQIVSDVAPWLGLMGIGLLVISAVVVPVMAVIAIIYNSPFAIFMPPLESGDTVMSVTSAYVSEFNMEINSLATEHIGYEVQGTDSHIKGFATVVFGGAFKINNIAILENKENGSLFVSMPRYKSRGVDQDNNPIYKDICNPTTKEFREHLYGDIMDAYHAIKEKDKAQETVTQEETEMPEFSVLVNAWSKDGSNVRGLASIYFEDCFIVNNVSILQGKENLFVAMPSYKTKKMDENNKPVYADVCYPITKEFREKLYTELITECEKQLKKAKEINPQTGKPYNRREQIQREEQEQEQADKEQSQKKQNSKKQEKKGR